MRFKTEIVEAVYRKTNLTRSQVQEVINLFIKEITGNFLNGEGVAIHGLGKFEIHILKDRNGTNPMTLEPIKCKGRKKVKFKLAETVDDILKERGLQDGEE